MITFDWPALFVLLPLPWLLRRLLPVATQSSAALYAPFFAQLEALPTAHPGATTRSGRTQLLPLLVPLLIWLLLVSAAAKPQWLGEPVGLQASGRDLLMAVDISGSMETPDFTYDNQKVTRLEAVRGIGGAFLERRVGDRLGLILYGERPYLQTPLTFDRTTVRTQLQEAEVGLAGRSTAIGDAIGLAVKHLRDRPADSRVLILLTDGVSNAGAMDPLQAAKLAAESKLRIFTIGIGADQMEVATFFGSRMVNPSADMDEKTLTEIARLTQGRYFRAHTPKELAEIYAEIDHLEPALAETRTMRPQKALFVWPLGLALLLSVGLTLWLGRPWWESRP